MLLQIPLRPSVELLPLSAIGCVELYVAALLDGELALAYAGIQLVQPMRGQVRNCQPAETKISV